MHYPSTEISEIPQNHKLMRGSLFKLVLKIVLALLRNNMKETVVFGFKFLHWCLREVRTNKRRDMKSQIVDLGSLNRPT